MSLTNPPLPDVLPDRISRSGSSEAPRFLLLALTLTLLAIGADQLASPILYSSSPLWAVTACILLVWRRGKLPAAVWEAPIGLFPSSRRFAAFVAAHLGLVLVARSLTTAVHSAAGTVTLAGTVLAVWKLCVLLPTVLLFPPTVWKELARHYSSEGIAALIVLVTFFPRRALEALWPWYGPLLGRLVYAFAKLFVPGLGYINELSPTLTGPDLDVTILLACSGINGLELFDYLFGFVAFLDWNRFRKGRALFVYFAGLSAMLLGNAIRISSFVILGNRGYAGIVSRFHISAGWMFFSGVFLVYLSVTYRWMLKKRTIDPQGP